MRTKVEMYPLGKAEDLIAQWIHDPTEQWLKQYNQDSAKRKNRRAMAFLCAWLKKNDVELITEYKQSTDKEEWAKQTGQRLVEWVNWLLQNGYMVNSARAFVGDVRAFFTYHCRPVKIGRRKIPKQQVATGEHEFSQTELRKMFHYADVRGKAILSTAVALGWSADDFLNLKRSEIEGLVSKALVERQQFIGFTHVRGKTGAESRSHLTPEAIESLKAYLDITPKGAVYLWANGALTDHLTNDTLNNILSDLVEKASIQTIGTVHFHLIRKFTMSTLSSAGIGDWDVKFMIGKEVPSDIATYLTNRKQNLMEEFQVAYPKLSLTGYANRNHDKLSELEAKVTDLIAQNKTTKWMLERMIEDPKFAEQVREAEKKKKGNVWKAIESLRKAPTTTEREE
jgi:site-specific recombinase XerD